MLMELRQTTFLNAPWQQKPEYFLLWAMAGGAAWSLSLGNSLGCHSHPGLVTTWV